jgi:hypothetical protein
LNASACARDDVFSAAARYAANSSASLSYCACRADTSAAVTTDETNDDCDDDDDDDDTGADDDDDADVRRRLPLLPSSPAAPRFDLLGLLFAFCLLSSLLARTQRRQSELPLSPRRVNAHTAAHLLHATGAPYFFNDVSQWRHTVPEKTLRMP